MGNRGSGFGIQLLSPARVSQGLLRGTGGCRAPLPPSQGELLAQPFQVKKSLVACRELQPTTLGLEVVGGGLRAASDPKQKAVFLSDLWEASCTQVFGWLLPAQRLGRPLQQRASGPVGQLLYWSAASQT